ncbi:hypothetical protein [Sorangium sp. So ce362]|uniref:hypothetical protein n=1 Tax=Sorangium sp. So ce362 TaxID=3133303 RepID=UPI003F6135F0
MAVAGAAQGPVGSPCGALYAPHQEVGRDGQGDRAGDWEGNFVKPRPWYNFWSKSETTIDGKDYVNGPKGVIHPGEMSGTPWDPKVHGVAKHPVTNLPPARLRRALSRFVEARDAALARLVPDDADLLPLDPGHDACDAYEAFGGALPAALRLRSFWGGATCSAGSCTRRRGAAPPGRSRSTATLHGLARPTRACS